MDDKKQDTFEDAERWRDRHTYSWNRTYQPVRECCGQDIEQTEPCSECDREAGGDA